MDDDPATISVTSKLTRYQVQPSRIRHLAGSVMSGLGVSAYDLDITFVSRQTVRRLNRDYRGRDYATDVLSFPQTTFRTPCRTGAVARPGSADPLPSGTLGDLVICPDVAAVNARSIGHGLDREVAFLMVHGILHLCGHDHEKPADERRMLREQRTLMERLSRPARRPSWTGIVRRKGRS